jgi:hypothetical protein
MLRKSGRGALCARLAFGLATLLAGVGLERIAGAQTPTKTFILN